MKRFLTSAAAATLLVAGTGSGALAQTATAPLFDLGVYGGLQYSTNWFESRAGEGYSIGPGPIFGAAATFWTTPSFGVRLHGSYFPSGGPEADDDNVGETDGDRYAFNNYFADLDLVFRPFSGPFLGVFASPYVFVGGGAMVTNVAGNPREDQIDCIGEYTALGVCMSYDPTYATVGQGVAGLGFDVMSLTSGIGLFGELAVHGYDSPAHNIRGDDELDKFAFTPRAVLGLKFGFGSLAPAAVPIPPMAPPPPPPAPPAPPAPPQENAIRVCVVQDGQLVDVDAVYRPGTGDTLVTVQGQRRPFGSVYGMTGTTYAGGQTWFINNETVRFNNRDYVKFGVPRIITPAELTRAGEFQGTGVWTQTGETNQNVIYVPIRAGCEFQAYQAREEIRPRG